MTTAANPLDTLAYANTVRIGGARWRRKVRAMHHGDARIAQARTLEASELPPEIGALRLGLFLRSARWMRVRSVLLYAGLTYRDPTTTRMRDLSYGERLRLARALRESAERCRREVAV